LPSSTPPFALPKFQTELSWQRFSAHERRGNSQPAFLDITNYWPKLKPQSSQEIFSAHETRRGTELPISQRFDNPSPSARNLQAQCNDPIAHPGQLHPGDQTIRISL
jgi:hypothetical protein